MLLEPPPPTPLPLPLPLLLPLLLLLLLLLRLLLPLLPAAILIPAVAMLLRRYAAMPLLLRLRLQSWAVNQPGQLCKTRAPPLNKPAVLDVHIRLRTDKESDCLFITAATSGDQSRPAEAVRLADAGFGLKRAGCSLVQFGILVLSEPFPIP